jgi:uncharacterized protein YqeY
MDLEQRLAEDLKSAMRSGDEDRKRTIRLIITALKYARIEARGELDESAQLTVLQRQARERRESIAEYERGRRPDLVAREQAELSIIDDYLPKQLTDEEIEAAARQQIAAVAASGPQDMGRVMRPLVKQLAGRADGARVNAIVKRLLAG